MSTVKFKRSAVTGKIPLTTDLELGEIAINTFDGKLFIKKNNGADSVVEIGAGGGGVTNLTYTANTSAITVASDTGTDAVVLAANTTVAGVVTTLAQSFNGVKTFSSNTVFSAGISANGSFGTAGQVLTSNATSTYWSTVSGGSFTGGTLTSPLTIAASVAGGSGLNFPAGVDPTAPVNGDMWVNASGLRFRLAGTTYSPAWLNAPQTFANKKTFGPSTTASAIFSLTPGVAPTTPIDGDMWTTTTGVFARINGATIDLGSGGAQAWAVQSANYTAVNGDRIIANTTAASFTITLPATPTTGAYVQIADGGNWSVNNLLIDRNGSTIEGIADTLAIDIGQATVEFIYDGTTWQFTA